MKIAVIKTGGKQYLVEKDKKIEIDKLSDDLKNNLVFKDVLLYADDNQFLIGSQCLNKVEVKAKFLREKKNKTLVLKYRSKTRYRKKKGYKKITWVVSIEDINLK